MNSPMVLARLRALVTVVALLLCLGTPVVTAARAEAIAAPAIPTGTDCLRPPTPASPTAGLASWIDKGPANAPKGDPFAEGSGTSLYDVYGYAGFDAIVFDPGCLDTSRIWDAPNEAANAMTAISAVGVAAAVTLTRLVMQGDLGSLWVPLQTYAAEFLGKGIFVPLLGIGVLLTGLVIVSRARKGDIAGETRASTFSALIIAGGAVAMLSGLTVGAGIDQGVTSAFVAANQVMTQTQGATAREPADAVAANLVGQVLYKTWANETFGGNEKVAREYGPRLFRAGALTRAEQAQIDADPAAAAKIIEAKKTDYKATAREIESKYPQAYAHVAGSDTRTRAGYAFAGLVGALAGVGYLIYALIKTVWSMVIARVGIGAAPMVALVAQVPRWHHLAMELLTWVVEAVVKAAAFGFLFVVYLVGGIGGIMDPATGWHPLVKAAALVMASIAMHLLLKRLGLVGGSWRTPRLRRGRPQPARTTAPAPKVGPPPVSVPVSGTRGVPPREALQLTRRVAPAGLPAGFGRKALTAAAPGLALSAVTPGGPVAPAVLALGKLASTTTTAATLARHAKTAGRALPGPSRAELPWRPTPVAPPNRAMTTRRVVTGRVVDDARLYRHPTPVPGSRALALYRPEGVHS